MKHYTVLTTFPKNRGSANVGDQLIEISLKSLIEREKGKVKFTTIFREEPLEPYLKEINRTSAVLMPGFAIRDTPMYPDCYRLTKDLSEIKVPMIPIGSNWNVYPGDFESRESVNYSAETRTFLKKIAEGVPWFSCREYHACRVLERHGIHNTMMTGDPAWYDPDFFNLPQRRIEKVQKIVFSPPLSPFYQQQAKEVIGLLTALYPKAKRICAMHLADAWVNPFEDRRPCNDASMLESVAKKNAAIREFAKSSGFEVREVSGDVKNIEFYKQCDLHVGYECHAHLAFLRWRNPSVLIAEDARGVGFNYTLGVGGFNGFVRTQKEARSMNRSGGTSGYCVDLEDYSRAPCSPTVVSEIRQFLREETASEFRRYAGIGSFIDDTYEKRMKPFLAQLP